MSTDGGRTVSGGQLPPLAPLRDVPFYRAVAKPSPWTFEIPQIREFMSQYVSAGGKGWADPFSGRSTIAEYTNDLRRDTPASHPHHLAADRFSAALPYGLEGVLFDPPYSYRQVTECYRGVGLRARQIDTSSNFYTRVRVQLAPRVRIGGLALSFGWNSNGFGRYQGFEAIDGLLVSFGGHHNDTIVTVERKVAEGPPAPPIREPLSRIHVE